MSFDSSFFEKVWPNTKKGAGFLVDSCICINWWGGIIIILLKCLPQQV